MLTFNNDYHNFNIVAELADTYYQYQYSAGHNNYKTTLVCLVLLPLWWLSVNVSCKVVPIMITNNIDSNIL